MNMIRIQIKLYKFNLSQAGKYAFVKDSTNIMSAFLPFTFFQAEEKRINKGYVDKFKGVKQINKCVVRSSQR